MRDVEELRVSHTIVAAGQNLLQGVAMGTHQWRRQRRQWERQAHLLSRHVVPGLGTNLFSVTSSMLKGVATLVHPATPRLKKDGVVVPMQQLGVDDTTDKVMYSIKVKLRGGAGDQMLSLIHI